MNKATPTNYNNLQFIFDQRQFCNSWLIESCRLQETLENLQYLISVKLLNNNSPVQSHPDYRFVSREPGAKNISIEQIRNLQDFLSKTSVISGHKTAVIYQADLMSLNAANSCLKMLEDTPENSTIFLITSRAASIIATIRSRCFKINLLPTNQEGDDSYSKFLDIVANHLSLDPKINLINEFSSKNKDLWLDFSSNTLRLINRITKKSSGVDISLNELENVILNRLPLSTPTYLMQKYQNIKRLVHDTIEYDLDLKASCILLLETSVLDKIL